MLDDTISKIQAQIETSASIDPARRAQLVKLLAELKSHAATLPPSHAQHVENIANYTTLSTQHLTGTPPNQGALAQSVERLEDSVRELEVTHPQLVAVVSRISTFLANMGI